MENRRQQTSVTMRPSPACPPLVAVIHSSQRRRRLKLLVSLLRLNLSKTSAASAEPAPWTKTGTYQSANPTPIWSMDRSMDIYGPKGYWTTSRFQIFQRLGSLISSQVCLPDQGNVNPAASPGFLGDVFLMGLSIYSLYGDGSKPCTPGEPQNSW